MSFIYNAFIKKFFYFFICKSILLEFLILINNTDLG